MNLQKTIHQWFFEKRVQYFPFRVHSFTLPPDTEEPRGVLYLSPSAMLFKPSDSEDQFLYQRIPSDIRKMLKPQAREITIDDVLFGTRVIDITPSYSFHLKHVKPDGENLYAVFSSFINRHHHSVVYRYFVVKITPDFLSLADGESYAYSDSSPKVLDVNDHTLTYAYQPFGTENKVHLRFYPR